MTNEFFKIHKQKGIYNLTKPIEFDTFKLNSSATVVNQLTHGTNKRIFLDNQKGICIIDNKIIYQKQKSDILIILQRCQELFKIKIKLISTTSKYNLWLNTTNFVYYSNFANNKIKKLIGQITTIQSGLSHSLMIDIHGKLVVFGFNIFGQLGIGRLLPTNEKMISPFKPSWLKNRVISGISCGSNHSGVILSCGECFLFGLNSEGQIGIVKPKDKYYIPPSRTTIPYLLFKSDSEIQDLILGGNRTIALTKSRKSIWFCGSKNPTSPKFQRVPKLLNFEALGISNPKQIIVKIVTNLKRTLIITQDHNFVKIAQSMNNSENNNRKRKYI